MKTIAQYFTSPKVHSESSGDRSLNGNKKQASVKILFEKTRSCNEKNKNKPIVKCSNEDEIEPTKRKSLQSRKKLNFDLETSNSHEPCNDSDDNLTNVKQSKECIEREMGKAKKCLNIQICSNGNAVNEVIEIKKYKQKNKIYCNKKSSNNITISKSMKRKSINEEVSLTSKKNKSENEQINRNHSKNLNSNHENATENNTTDRDTSRSEIRDKQNDSIMTHSKTKRKIILQTKFSEKIVEENTSPKLPLQDMSSPIISEKQNEGNISSLKTKRKSSLQSKLPKQIVEKTTLPEQPLILKKSNNKSKEDNNNIKGIKNCLSNSKKNALKKQVVDNITDSELDNSLEIFDSNKFKRKIKTTLADKECKLEQNVDNSKVSPSDKNQGNSLFSYFNKVDKETAMTKQQHNTIKVKALIHSPPKIEPKRSKCRNSLDKLSLNGKSSGLKTKALMKASDKIDVLSSEILKLQDESLTNSTTEVSSNLPVCVNDDNITPKKKTSGIENYFKVNTMDKTPIDNVQKISVSASKSWTMRVRLTHTSGKSTIYLNGFDYNNNNLN